MVCKKSFDFAIVGMLTSGMVSMCLSLDINTSIFGCFKRFDGFLSFVVYILLFYFVVYAVKPVDLDLFFKSMILTCAVCCLYGMVQWLGLDIYKWRTDVKSRPGSTIGHPSIFAGYIVMILPLVYYYNVKIKWWSYPVVFLMLFVLMITQTKGAFIGAVISGAWFCWFSNIKKWLFVLIIMILLITGMYLPASPVKRIYNELYKNELSGSSLYHYQMVFVGIDIIKDYPIFGVGQDCLGKVYKEYYIKRYTSKVFEDQNRLHNEFLDVTVDTGLVGLGAWIFFLVCYFRIVWERRKDPLMIAVSAGVVAYLTQNQFIFGHIPTLTMFWAMVGMTVVMGNKKLIQGN